MKPIRAGDEVTLAFDVLAVDGNYITVKRPGGLRFTVPRNEAREINHSAGVGDRIAWYVEETDAIPHREAGLFRGVVTSLTPLTVAVDDRLSPSGDGWRPDGQSVVVPVGVEPYRINEDS